MSNPYDSSAEPSNTRSAAPAWYWAFYYGYEPVWWIGTILIACSWFRLVSPTIGWIGFGMSAAMWAGARVLPRLAGLSDEEHVLLDSRMLKAKDYRYHDSINRFVNGATLFYDGVAFAFRGDEIAAAIAAPEERVEEDHAIELGQHAEDVFGALQAESEEFSAAVVGYTFRISVIAGQAQKEVFRISAGGDVRRV